MKLSRPRIVVRKLKDGYNVIQVLEDETRVWLRGPFATREEAIVEARHVASMYTESVLEV